MAEKIKITRWYTAIILVLSIIYHHTDNINLTTNIFESNFGEKETKVVCPAMVGKIFKVARQWQFGFFFSKSEAGISSIS